MPKPSPHEDKMLNLQYQMKQNNADLQNFLKDLDNWEEEVKQIDQDLKSKKTKNTEESALPPVRNSLDKKKFKKKVKKKEGSDGSKPKRISSYDYRSWDKFDVDKACENVDSDGKSSSDGEYETDEEWENERKKQAAVLEKDKGNEYFKKGDYNNAIECYTKGADLDPTNPLLPANRAMALLKQDKFAVAELDCSVALSLDPLYTKAYLRRGSARIGLRKYQEAKSDFEKVLQLEPQNKKAKSDIEFIDKQLAKEKLVSHSSSTVTESVGIVKAISKSPAQCSKKPLKRIEIEEIGIDEIDIKSAVAKTEATQSQVKKDIVQKDSDTFSKFTANSPADIAMSAVKNISINNDEQIKSDPNVPTGSIQCDNNEQMTPTKSKFESVVQSKTDTSPRRDETKETSQTSKVTQSEKQLSPRSSSVPVNSVQFQAEFRKLKTDLEGFYQYFKRIPVTDYLKLFGQFLDADVLQTVFDTIKKHYIPNGEDYFSCLKHLTLVSRFSMVVMFMSKKEKQVLLEIFTHLHQSGLYSEDDISSLKKKYEL
ncbi:RNA polymerase II-associated protein 3 [Mactra antiquata]